MTESKQTPEVDVDDVKARMEQHAMEALRDLFHRLPFGEKIILSNGKEAEIKVFMKPKPGREPNDEGFSDHLSNRPHCGIDVTYTDGSGHLEFILYQSGWGGRP